MLDVEIDHQHFLFRQAHNLNKNMSANIFRENSKFNEECKELIRKNYELLEEGTREVEDMDQHLKGIEEQNMSLKSALHKAERTVREMGNHLNAIDPYIKWEPIKRQTKKPIRNNSRRSSMT